MLGYPIIIYVQHLYLEFKSSVSTTIEKTSTIDANYFNSDWEYFALLESLCNQYWNITTMEIIIVIVNGFHNFYYF